MTISPLCQDLEIAPQPASSSSSSSGGELVPSPRTQAKRCSQVENKSGLAIFRTITVCTETGKLVTSALLFVESASS